VVAILVAGSGETRRLHLLLLQASLRNIDLSIGVLLKQAVSIDSVSHVRCVTVDSYKVAYTVCV
jgi:hypothetical protein